jgi:hypothetical protein
MVYKIATIHTRNGKLFLLAVLLIAAEDYLKTLAPSWRKRRRPAPDMSPDPLQPT